jgi:signal transduction histidine kinase
MQISRGRSGLRIVIDPTVSEKMSNPLSAVAPYSVATLLLISFTVCGMQPDLPPLSIQGTNTSYRLTGKMAILEDKSNALTLSDVLKTKQGFEPVGAKGINFGPSNSTFWIQFSIVNFSRKEWFLHIGTPFLKDVELYRITKNGGLTKSTIGSARPFRAREVMTSQSILPLDLVRGDTSWCYLRVRSNSIVRVPLEVATMQQIFESNQTSDIANGFYFGLIAALILYNLFVFVSIKEKTYLYYVFYTSFVTVNISYLRGYLLQFFVPNFPLANHTNFSGAIAFTSALLFTDSFLNTALHCPRIRKMSWIIYALLAFVFIISLAGYLLLGFVIIWCVVVLFFIYMATVGIIVLKKGFAPARFYLAGFSFLLTGVIIYMLKDNAIIPENWFTESSYQIGSALEAIILSYALANKLNTFKKEKEHSKALALAQATQFSQQLIASQESERKRIAAELHDSLGQSLGMVKNKVLMIKRDIEKPDIRDKQVVDLETMVTETIQEVRIISYNLRPLHLELLGITQSIHSLLEDIMENGNIEIEVQIQQFDNLLSKTDEINVFRIVQECFNNIIKHAQATHTRISLKVEDSAIYLQIEDNGVGMPKTVEGPTGFGLIGIRERLNILNGQLDITDNIPSGTVMNITIFY